MTFRRTPDRTPKRCKCEDSYLNLGGQAPQSHLGTCGCLVERTTQRSLCGACAFFPSPLPSSWLSTADPLTITVLQTGYIHLPMLELIGNPTGTQSCRIFTPIITPLLPRVPGLIINHSPHLLRDPFRSLVRCCKYTSTTLQKEKRAFVSLSFEMPRGCQGV